MECWKNLKDFLLSFYYPKEQFFLVSFPKTGRTWLFYMIKKMKKLSNHPLKDSSSFIFQEHDNSEIIIENGTRNNPLDIFNYTSRYKYRRGKVIFLVRDPRDVVVSHYHQVTKRAERPFVFSSISEFVKDNVLGFKRIIHFYNLWLKNKHIPKEFILIKYEDLLESGLTELQKINHFLNLNISKSDIENIYNNSSADKIRKKELANKLEGFKDFGKDRNQLKVRNAKIGGFKDELSNEDILYCNEEMKMLSTYFNYKI